MWAVVSQNVDKVELIRFLGTIVGFGCALA